MLWASYSNLIDRFPEDCTHLFGSIIDGNSGLWFSINRDGFPFLLFEAEPDNTQADLKLKSFDVEFARHCDITLEDGTAKSGVYTLVRLNEDDPDIVRVFLRLLEEAFLVSPERYNTQTIRRKILEIVDLFSRIEANRSDVIGLWGELYLICNSVHPKPALQSWCLAKGAKYDFVTNHCVLEVKSTLKPSRQHRFSLEQLRPNSKAELYVVSILLIELPSGQTVGDLIDEIYEGISDTEDRKIFFNQCLTKGGKEIYRSDLQLGVFPDDTSIEVYDAKDIPVPVVESEDPISNVRFDINLNGILSIEGAIRKSILEFSESSRACNEAL